MSLDLYTAQEAITSFLAGTTPFRDGRIPNQDPAANVFDVFTGGIEEAQTLVATNGILRPHVVLRFSSPQPTLADRSFAGARYDGQYATVDAMCIADSDEFARQLSTKVARVLVGHRANANVGELNLDWGGGTFTVISEGSRPQFYISWLSLRFAANLYDVGA